MQITVSARTGAGHRPLDSTDLSTYKASTRTSLNQTNSSRHLESTAECATVHHLAQNEDTPEQLSYYDLLSSNGQSDKMLPTPSALNYKTFWLFLGTIAFAIHLDVQYLDT